MKSGRVKELEKEVQELRLEVKNLYERLGNAESFIKDIKNNPGLISPTEDPKEIPKASEDNNNNSEVLIPVSSSTNPNPTEVATESNDNNNNSEVSIPIVSDTQPVNEDNTKDESVQVLKFTKKIKAESWIGKILMGVLASLLIFIALITFAKVLLPYLTDTMKIALMFIASTALTATGFIFSKKKPENTFFTALLACGSACIYLSILVTGIYFKAISSIVMYILIALWAALIIFFKKNQNDWLFFVVGNLGYLVSLIFTGGLDDESYIIPVLIYVIMISMVYQVMYWKNERQRHTQNILNIISLLLFQIIMTSVFERTTKIIVVGIIAVAYTFIDFTAYILSDLRSYKKVHFYIGVFNVIAYLIAYFLLFIILKIKVELQIILSFIIVIIPAIILELINMYWRNKKLAENESLLNTIFSGLLFFLASVIIAARNHFLFYSGFILVAYSLIVVYGIIKKEPYFKVQGWVLACSCVIIEISILKFNPVFTIVVAILILLSLIVEGIVINDSEPFKIVSYIALLGWIVRICTQMYGQKIISMDIRNVEVIIYGILALLNMIMILTKFYKLKNKEEEGKKTHIVLDTINLIFMFFGLGIMSAEYDNLLRTIYMIIVLILAFINLPIKDKGSRARYLYTGLKFAAIIFYSLTIYETANFVKSICMIAYAVLCIALGFRNRSIGKSLRIFGLVMTLIFVIKFIIIDISYDNSIMKACSYLISGMLCFGISIIYNYFEKKQGKNSTSVIVN